MIGIEDIGNGNASGDEDNFFFLTSAWMEGGRWVDETETKTICDNCEESESTSATIVRSVSASSVARIYTVVGKENFTSFTKLKNDGIVKLRQT